MNCLCAQWSLGVQGSHRDPRSQVGTVSVLPVATGLAITLTLLALRTTLEHSDAR
jgi:hypothetical protein